MNLQASEQPCILKQGIFSIIRLHKKVKKVYIIQYNHTKKAESKDHLFLIFIFYFLWKTQTSSRDFTETYCVKYKIATL